MKPVKEVGIKTKIDMKVSACVCTRYIHIIGKGRHTNMFIRKVMVVNVTNANQLNLLVMIIMKHCIRLPWKY